jgi:hypothetical protein
VEDRCQKLGILENSSVKSMVISERAAGSCAGDLLLLPVAGVALWTLAYQFILIVRWPAKSIIWCFLAIAISGLFLLVRLWKKTNAIPSKGYRFKEDVIEFFVWLESVLELLLVRESDGKFARWTALLCDFYNLRADVNAFALTGMENSQKIARAAANRENFLLRLYQKTKEPVKQFVIVSVAVDPALAPSSNLVQMISRALASLLKGGWSPRRCVRLALVRKSGHAAATV